MCAEINLGLLCKSINQLLFPLDMEIGHNYTGKSMVSFNTLKNQAKLFSFLWLICLNTLFSEFSSRQQIRSFEGANSQEKKKC